MANLGKVSLCACSSHLSNTFIMEDHNTFIMEDHCDDVHDGARDRAHDDADDALAPGSFQDLMELLEELDHDSPREPLAGMAFFVSPAQYLTVLQIELPCNIGPSDYSCNILYYKSRTSHIHRSLTLFFIQTLFRQLKGRWMKNTTIKEILGTDAIFFPIEVRDDDDTPTLDLTPDVALSFSDGENLDLFRSPPLVVEVMYAHKFSYEQAEKRYQQYFRAKDCGVKIVICLRLYYTHGVDRAKKTAEKLDRSSVSMWTMDKDGNIQTVMR